MSFNAFKIVTIFAGLILFTCPSAMAEKVDLFSFYESDDRYEFYLTEEKADQCDELYEGLKRTRRMCYRVSARDKAMTVDKIRACSRNFYWSYDMLNCLKFAPLIRLEEINECGSTYSDRFRPMKGMICIGEAVGGAWRLEYEDRIFQD